jgi:hypothetical protein
MSEQLPGGGIELSPDEIEALHARWSFCWPPSEVAQRLAGIDTPWYVAAGWALDLFREPHDGDTWICRRDERIRLPYSDIIHRTHAGIPYLAPEPVLLFKAKHARQKDQSDFDATVPHMTPVQRETLTELLARVHPGHPWIGDLQLARAKRRSATRSGWAVPTTHARRAPRVHIRTRSRPQLTPQSAGSPRGGWCGL